MWSPTLCEPIRACKKHFPWPIPIHFKSFKTVSTCPFWSWTISTSRVKHMETSVIQLNLYFCVRDLNSLPSIEKPWLKKRIQIFKKKNKWSPLKMTSKSLMSCLNSGKSEDCSWSHYIALWVAMSLNCRLPNFHLSRHYGLSKMERNTNLQLLSLLCWLIREKEDSQKGSIQSDLNSYYLLIQI